MFIDADFGSNGLQLEASLGQSELLWRIWRENISRPGRTAASVARAGEYGRRMAGGRGGLTRRCWRSHSP